MKDAKGFTLIESLVSMVLLVITMLAAIAFYDNTNKLLTLASHKKAAVELANSRMEELKGVAYDAPELKDTNGVKKLDGSISVGKDTATEWTSQRSLKIDDVDPTPGNKYKEILVSVQWTDAIGTDPRSIEFITYKTP